MTDAQRTKRYERKFIADQRDFYSIQNIIKFHPGAFRPIHRSRFINNLYLDTPNFKFYYDNHFGKAERIKVRIRWYSDRFKTAANPFLEIKRKHGLVGDKEVYPIEAFTIGTYLDTRQLMNHLQNASLPDDIKAWIKHLEPKIANRYQRCYYLSADKKFRLTLDRTIEYYAAEGRMSTLKKCSPYQKNCIVELKYKVSDEINADEITRHIPFRINKNSKYINGVDCFNYMAAV